MKYFRDTLLEGDDFEKTYDMDVDWWKKWKEAHEKDYKLDRDEFQKTVTVKKDGVAIFTYDEERRKVFTNKGLDFLTEGVANPKV